MQEISNTLITNELPKKDSYLNSILNNYFDEIKGQSSTVENLKYINIPITLTKKEINTMPKNFQKHFILEGLIVNARKRTLGKNGCSYEIRYRKDGYNLSVSGTTVEIVKHKFIEKIKSLNNKTEELYPNSFTDFATFYIENYKNYFSKYFIWSLILPSAVASIGIALTFLFEYFSVNLLTILFLAPPPTM